MIAANTSRTRSIARGIGAAFLVLMSRAHGAPVAPPSMPDELEAKATLRFQPATQLALGKLTVRFEETRLRDVIGAARIGAIDHEGDAGDSIYWICFTQTKPEHTDRIWLTSDEMGGSDHAIMQVIAARLPVNTPAEDGCPELPSLLAPATLDRGIWLGASEATVTKKLGTPSTTEGKWRLFYYAGVLPMKYRAPRDERAQIVNADVTNLLSVQVEGGKVVGLRVIHVTSF